MTPLPRALLALVLGIGLTTGLVPAPVAAETDFPWLKQQSRSIERNSRQLERQRNDMRDKSRLRGLETEPDGRSAGWQQLELERSQRERLEQREDRLSDRERLRLTRKKLDEQRGRD